MTAYLEAIEYFVPEQTLTNEELARRNPAWDADKIYQKTGIRTRHIAAEDETAADLGYQAAEKLLSRLDVDRSQIDALLFCTQSADYFLPTTACVLQPRLQLPQSCGALDFNLGCSGFTYGLWLTRSLILGGGAQNILLITADTYSKYCGPEDMATATIFGDGAAAALVTKNPVRPLAQIGPTVVGTDGRGAENLIVRAGCARSWADRASSMHSGMQQGDDMPRLAMNGPAIFSFTISAVKSAIQNLLGQLQMDWGDVDWFLFHQANGYMLQQLRRSLRIPAEKLPIDVEELGNTVSATIPILLRRMVSRGQIQGGQRGILAGFGVGYSWAITYLEFETPHSTV